MVIGHLSAYLKARGWSRCGSMLDPVGHGGSVFTRVLPVSWEVLESSLVLASLPPHHHSIFYHQPATLVTLL